MTDTVTDNPSTASYQSDPLGFDKVTFFRNLRAMLRDCDRVSKHDKVHIVIVACLEAGLTSRTRIIGVAKSLGFSGQHAGKLLNDGAGDDPSRHHWQRTPGGAYQLHR